MIFQLSLFRRRCNDTPAVRVITKLDSTRIAASSVIRACIASLDCMEKSIARGALFGAPRFVSALSEKIAARAALAGATY